MNSSPGRRLRAIRRAKDVTQARLAADAGMPQQVVSAIEVGREPMWPGYRARLSAALGIDPADLI